LKKGGDVFPLVGDSGTIHGAILKPKENVSKPIYISIGHRLSLETSIHIVKLCCKFRIPEPIRQADRRSRGAIKKINRDYEMQNMKNNEC
jgi:deoxyinosine 3'endonuclease (endonuclease V)